MPTLSTLPNPAKVRMVLQKRAFTLVEAVISLGIVSFAMMGILGMIPVGLSTFRNAMNLTVESAIAQNVADTVQRTDYTNLTASTFYFDSEGTRVDGGNSGRIFTVEVPAPQPLDAGNLVNPAAAKSMTIRISNRAQPSVTNSYSVIVPRSN